MWLYITIEWIPVRVGWMLQNQDSPKHNLHVSALIIYFSIL